MTEPTEKTKSPKAPLVFGAALLAAIAASLVYDEGGRILKPYLDSVGIPTACMGIIGPEVTARYKAKQLFTDEECAALESKYILKMVRQMNQCIPNSVLGETKQDEYIAYAHFTYNVGTGAFCNSSVARKLALGDRVGACKGMAAWTYVTYKGKKRNCRDADMRRICRGIVIRRDKEVQMCLSAL